MKKITLFLIAFIATLQTQATHIIGGQITSRCLGGLTQEVTLTLFRDNQGLPPTSEIITYSANTFTYITFSTVSPGPVTVINNTTDMYQLIDTITLPYIDSYTISNSNCCRPATILNITNPANTPVYLDLIVSVDTICNSSPIAAINSYGIAYVGNIFTYNISATDLDGDSLGYSLVATSDATNTPTLGYTIPLGATISNSGIFSWTPSSPGTYSFCFRIDEYRNGNLIGYTRRETRIDVGIFNSINEINNQYDPTYKYYDLLGRKVNSDFKGVKIHE